MANARLGQDGPGTSSGATEEESAQRTEIYQEDKEASSQGLPLTKSGTVWTWK